MKTHKRFSIIFTLVIIFSLILVGGAAAKGPNNKNNNNNKKVDLCQNNGNGTYSLVKVKADTLQTHLSHGDLAPGSTVPGQVNTVLSANCAVTSMTQNPQVPVATEPPTNGNGKKAEKVNVCHRRGNGTFILINVNGNAVPAHLAHGDCLPDGGVPTMPGKFFTTTCSVSDVPREELVETLSVTSEIQTVVTSLPLVSGQQYKIKASGTYIFDDFDHWADAEWFSRDGITVEKEWPGLPANVLDLTINGCTTDTDWGAYQTSHEYTLDWMGTGASVSFCIFDVKYTDNHGSLTVEIWKINW